MVHAVGTLQAIYTIAVLVYVDETKVKVRDRTYYLWLAVDEKGLPVFMHLSRGRDFGLLSWFFTTQRQRYASLTRDLIYENFWEEECGREMVFLHQAQNKEVHKRFPWNAKYETVYRWLASFIIYTIMNLKS
jgi:transposase-like protein